MNVALPKRRQIFTTQHGVTSHKDSTFNNTVVKNFKSHIMRVSLKLSLVVSELWARWGKNPSQTRLLDTGRNSRP